MGLLSSFDCPVAHPSPALPFDVPKVHARFQESSYQRVRHPRSGGELWKKKRGDKEAMVRQLDDPDLFIVVDSGHSEPAISDLPTIPWVEVIVAAVLLCHLFSLIDLIDKRVWHEPHPLGPADE
jgi:hypothetical protein